MPQNVAFRARLVLLAGEGCAHHRIAALLRTSRPTVLLWRKRFAPGGPQALRTDAPGRGRKIRAGPEKVRAVIQATLHSKPPAETHWSVRTMAQAQGRSPATVQRIWDAHGRKPHRVKTFQWSHDPQFLEKLSAVVGLYRNPPDKALVLCLDEKSQIQALHRTPPGLPLRKGRCGTMTHDYKRNGTATLFAALNVLQGTVIGDCYPRHRHQKFLKFLRRIDRDTPPGLDRHLILDNYGTHKHPAVQRWLRTRKRFHWHFTPTSSSWLNLVERWLRELTQKRIRRGSFHSVQELIAAIHGYLEHNHKHPKPFVWTASVEQILEKIARCKATYETLH